MMNQFAFDFDQTAAAKELMELDAMLRAHVQDEEIFERWLLMGVPDGTESWEELLPLTESEFDEMVALAWDVLAEDEGDPEFEYEPNDIDSDEGFDPYEGCFTWDC